MPRKPRSRSVILVILLCTVVPLLVVGTALAIRHKQVVYEGHLRLGCEQSGMRLDQVNTVPDMLPEVFNQRIFLAHWPLPITIIDLNQLRGCVSIRDSATALKYVRLRTALTTWNLWPGAQQEVEIIRHKEISRLPNYGVEFRYGLGDEMGPNSSGFMGILSDEAYSAGRFQPPLVTAQPDGFLITRWTYRNDVRQIQEHVGFDGSYQRTVLKRMPPPNLPKTNWHWPMFA